MNCEPSTISRPSTRTRTMTRRERLLCVFEGRVPDRTPVKVWDAGLKPAADRHPAFAAVHRAALAQSDLVVQHTSPFCAYAGVHAAARCHKSRMATDRPEWELTVTDYETPRGMLRGVHRGRLPFGPGYQMEYPLKEPADVGRLLSMPYAPYPLDPARYWRADAELGDAGVTLFMLDHAAYALQQMIGSENFALWSLSSEDVLLGAIRTFAERIRAHAKQALAAGVRLFGWCGPELFIPPLLSPAGFEKFVYDIDKPLIDLIHDGGGRVWVHCHGKMGPVLERFAEMGVDVLNPLEPPPMGDVSLDEAFARLAGGPMALEGNIETHDIMRAGKDELREKIDAALRAGQGRPMILCTSAAYNENHDPSPVEIENWLFYIGEGIRAAERLAWG